MQIVKHIQSARINDVERYHLINVTLQKLQDCIARYRYCGNNHGMIPPQEIRGAVSDVLDAAQTLRDLL